MIQETSNSTHVTVVLEVFDGDIEGNLTPVQWIEKQMGWVDVDGIYFSHVEDKMKLSKRDCENLLDALAEYDDSICPKELDDDEVGLNAERLDDLTERLTKHAYSAGDE